MKCAELQFDLSLYERRNDGTPNAVDQHLEHCPVCREHVEQFEELRSGLRGLSRPALTGSAVRQLRQTVVAEAKADRPLFGAALRRCIEFRLMPYGIGAAASVTIGFGFLALLFSSAFQADRSVGQRRNDTSAILLAKSFDPMQVSGPDDISPNDLVRDRMAFAGESPSVNPQGALIALTKSVVRGEMRDEEVVIVAEVLGNGLARISEVVEPADDHRIVQELRKALDGDPAAAPFVPASIENRPDSVRVVFMLQSVNVSIRGRRGRARL